MGNAWDKYLNAKLIGGCAELKARLGLTVECCTSCHFEQEDGEEICAHHEDDGWYEVCCNVARAADGKEA